MSTDDPRNGDTPNGAHGPQRDAARVELRALDEADRMWAALEGDLAPEENARFEDRVARDGALRRRVREGRALDGLLPLYTAPEASPDFARSALARLEAEGLLRPAWYARRISLPLPVAAALLLAAGLFTAWFLRSGSGSTSTPAAEVAVVDSPAESSPALAPEERPLRRSFGPRIVIGAAGSAAALFDLEAEDELFPLDAAEPQDAAESRDAGSGLQNAGPAPQAEVRDR